MDFSLSPLLPVDSLLCASFNGFIGSLSKRWPICFSFPNQLRKLCRRRRQKKTVSGDLHAQPSGGRFVFFSCKKERRGPPRTWCVGGGVVSFGVAGKKKTTAPHVISCHVRSSPPWKHSRRIITGAKERGERERAGKKQTTTSPYFFTFDCSVGWKDLPPEA